MMRACLRGGRRRHDGVPPCGYRCHDVGLWSPALVCADAALRRPAPSRPCVGLSRWSPPLRSPALHAHRCAPPARAPLACGARSAWERTPLRHRAPSAPRGRTQSHPVVRKTAQSYPYRTRSYATPRGRTQLHAVVRNSTRSYLRRDLRYDRAFPGTTTRPHVRPRAPRYDHAFPGTTTRPHVRPHKHAPGTHIARLHRLIDYSRLERANHPGTRVTRALGRALFFDEAHLPFCVTRARTPPKRTPPDAHTAQAGRRTQTTASERRPASPSGPVTSRHRSRPASTCHPSVAPARPARSSAGV